MALPEDLITFDIIETHKENIQSLPGGRSAKALASTFAPLSLNSPLPTPGSTRNLNDAIRQEYELELASISDSDDPLDVYDRYVKWTLNAYTSAQATPESQLRPLLERATKAFQTANHYKNDPRYLKLWLNYIRLFSDAPRETFAYLARHNIGEGLALFYEEFAAWLEGAGRWTQAEEVFRLGIDREARPVERMLRKFGEFRTRLEQQPRNGEEPLSPALPTVRPALVAKLDPFASSTPRASDPQAQVLPASIGVTSTSRSGRQKLAVFSDADTSLSDPKTAFGQSSTGWDNIGSIKDRKQENTMEAKPWAGETMKVGKKSGGPPKMPIFKDESIPQHQNMNNAPSSIYASQQQIVNAKTGRIERVFVDLEAVYPNVNDTNEEYCFEELRAKHRGWIEKDWKPKKNSIRKHDSEPQEPSQILEEYRSGQHGSSAFADQVDPEMAQKLTDSLVSDSPHQPALPSQDRNTLDDPDSRPKKMKIMEVKAETQTIKTNLDSPAGPKLRRKNSAEPTMTLHTRAATDDILDIFNQPLRNMGPIGSHHDSAGESDYDEDDYTSGGESTGTGHLSVPSEMGDETEANMEDVGIQERTENETAAQWSDYTSKRDNHKNALEDILNRESDDQDDHASNAVNTIPSYTTDEPEDLVTPNSPPTPPESEQLRFVPIPPEDYEPPTRPYRDPAQVSQNRLPFMTPIVEKTESSLGFPTVREEKGYFNSKTPSRRKGDGTPLIPEVNHELSSSPFQEIINEAVVRPQIEPCSLNKATSKKTITSTSKVSVPPKDTKGPIINDVRCNPVDESIRNTILEKIQPPFSTYTAFFDYRPKNLNKGPEVRKFVKALTKVSKNEKTQTNLSMPPALHFPKSAHPYTIKRELGKGAFAPVYLAEQSTASENDEESILPSLSAIKAEDPPSAWEYYIMTLAHRRLGISRASESIAKAYSMHLFADEGYLVEEYRDQGTLLDLVNLARSDPGLSVAGGSTTPTGVLDEMICMFFTVELLRTVEALHSKGIMHGDLKADNCLVRLSPTDPPSSSDTWSPAYSPSGSEGWSSKGLLLIDFGRGIDMRAFSTDVQFIADWKTSKQDCAEMREMRPWTWQIDYWGIAGVAHTLLFGKYIEDVVEKNNAVSSSSSQDVSSSLLANASIGGGLKRYKVKEPLKRYWNGELWGKFFDILLNPMRYTSGEEGARMPVNKALKGVREGMEMYLVANAERKNLKGALRRLEERCRERRR